MVSSVHSFQPALINVYGVGGLGKSATLRALFDLVKQSPSFHQIDNRQINTEDFRAIFSYKGKIVGIMSMGDPSCEEEVRAFLNDCKANHCDMIFTASRTRGAIFGMVIDFANTNNYRFIETSPLYIRGTDGYSESFEFLHKAFASMLESLI